MMVTSKLEKRALVTTPASGCGHGFVVRDLDLLLFLLSLRVDPRPLDLFEFLWLGTSGSLPPLLLALGIAVRVTESFLDHAFLGPSDLLIIATRGPARESIRKKLSRKKSLQKVLT